MKLKFKNYIILMRTKHYIKSLLIFVPAFFDSTLFNKKNLLKMIFGFAAFCLICSSVYIINDIFDKKSDKNHPVKCKRPIASGAVSVKEGIILAVFFIIIGYTLLSKAAGTFWSMAHLIMIIYLLLNMAYSWHLKNVPIIDVLILASGFLLRILFGGALCSIRVSEWLYLTVMMISLYMGIGKRKNEIQKKVIGETRQVLKFYTKHYLEKMMQMCMILGLAFYALWSSGLMNSGNRTSQFLWTVPLVFSIVMRYEMIVEKDGYADPTEVFYSDKAITAMTAVYILSNMMILYGNLH